MQTQEANAAARPSKAWTGMTRLGIGLLLGILAYLIGQAERQDSGIHAWAIRHSPPFAIAVALTVFVPLVALVETGRMRARRLLIYLIAVGAGVAALTAYDNIWIAPTEVRWKEGIQPHFWPSAVPLLLCIALGLFIVNQLLEHRERGYALCQHYTNYFDDSWMRGMQLALSAVFTLLVWGVLSLGAQLFYTIHISILSKLVRSAWFLYPVQAVAFAASIHLTDVRPALVTGMRNLCLMLLSWLLPLIVLLGCGFLAALCVTGLTPLWQTGHGALLLLMSATITICLVNAAYKDGDPANAPPAPVRWAGRIAGPMLLVFAALAAYAVLIRIEQYGWSAPRVLAAAVTVMTLVYGAGYGWASLTRGPWLRRVERVNITASIIALGMLLALLTPLANPQRLAVQSQVARLQAGKTAPKDFDFNFLRFHAGRYGTDALAALAADPQHGEIAALAGQALKWTQPSAYPGGRDRLKMQREQAIAQAKVYPNGDPLAEDFIQAVRGANIDLSEYGIRCAYRGTACEIDVLAQGPAGTPALLIHAAQDADIAQDAIMFGRNAQGNWQALGSVNNLKCPGVLDALRQGKVAPVRKRYDDLLASGARLVFNSRGLENETACSNESKP